MFKITADYIQSFWATPTNTPNKPAESQTNSTLLWIVDNAATTYLALQVLKRYAPPQDPFTFPQYILFTAISCTASLMIDDKLHNNLETLVTQTRQMWAKADEINDLKDQLKKAVNTQTSDQLQHQIIEKICTFNQIHQAFKAEIAKAEARKPLEPSLQKIQQHAEELQKDFNIYVRGTQ